MLNPGPIALRAVDDALSNVGVTEDRVNGVWSNWGKWVSMYLAAVGIKSPAAWCLAWAEFRWQKAAQELGKSLPPDLPITGYCPTLGTWAVKNHCTVPFGQAQKGDLLLLWFPSLGGWHHAAMVVGLDGRAFQTVEGNTNPGGSRDGYGVFRRTRSFDSLDGRSIVVRLTF